MKKRLNILLLAIALPVLLLSCSSASRVKQDQVEITLPERYSLYSEERASLDRWWEQLGEPELDGFIDEAFSGNFTLQEAWARLRQAEATAIQARSAHFPALDLTADASNARSSGQSTNSYSLGLASSYEVDLWGRVRSGDEAAKFNASASREDLYTAAMTLSAQIADSWINIITQRKEKALLEKQLQTNRIFLELIELRFRNSLASALDVFQQKESVAQIEVAIPQIEASEQLLTHELALLLGKAPQMPLDITVDELPDLDDLPPTGLPADLLAARPDIRAAGMRLYAARWDVETARANRLPAIRLAAKAGYSADKVSDIFDNWLANLAANLTAPIFNGNRLRAEVDRTKAVEDERLANYRGTVLTALKEVEDAIVSEEKLKQQIKALRQQLLIARKALNEARERYMRGLNDYLPVLAETRSVQNLERDIIRKERDLLSNRISLYRALGGSWMDGIKSPPDKS